MHLDPTIPDNLRNWFGYFLQPGLVSPAPVVQKNMRERCQRKIAFPGNPGLNLLPEHCRLELGRRSPGFLKYTASAQGLTPKFSRIGIGGNFALQLLPG